MSALPLTVTDALVPHLGGIRSVTPVGGGCIANASRVEGERGTAFLKWSGGEAGTAFESEAAGLAALRAADSRLLIPEVIAVENAEGSAPGFLLMEWVPPAAPSPAYWEALGEGLAAMHRQQEEEGRYGFAGDNFIGRLPQRNAWQARWPDFFRAERLEPQIAMARERGRWRQSWDAPAERLLAHLDEVLPMTPPASVLHGDLWSGNALPAEGDRAALVDPAAYYGHREADLALTELFGGFDGAFYDAYRDAWSLEPGYPERREVYNLYHLINHLNHFGESYAGQVERTLRRFG